MVGGGLDKATIANPTTHYGPGKPATRHFTIQRLTGMANVLFLLFLVGIIVKLAGADRAEMIDIIRNPLVAIVLALLVVNVPVHMRIGMNEVIEDYVHGHFVNRLAMFANTVFAILIALAGLGAIAKIVFWG